MALVYLEAPAVAYSEAIPTSSSNSNNLVHNRPHKRTHLVTYLGLNPQARHRCSHPPRHSHRQIFLVKHKPVPNSQVYLDQHLRPLALVSQLPVRRDYLVHLWGLQRMHSVHLLPLNHLLPPQSPSLLAPTSPYSQCSLLALVPLTSINRSKRKSRAFLLMFQPAPPFPVKWDMPPRIQNLEALGPRRQAQ